MFRRIPCLAVDVVPEPRPLDDGQVALWSAFVDAYGATATRPAVDVFLRALIGAPTEGDR
jgi:hypothetical protein